MTLAQRHILLPAAAVEPARAPATPCDAETGFAFPPGADGSIGYVAKMFPRISETFILQEVLALRRHGVPVHIYSLLPPTRDARVHAEAEALLPDVQVLPEISWRRSPMLIAALARCVRRRPVPAMRAVLGALRPWKRGMLKRLLRAVLLAERMHEDRVAHLHAAWAHTPASVGRIAARLNGIPWSMGAHAKDIYLADPASLAKKLRSARYTLTCTQANVRFLRDLADDGSAERAQPWPPTPIELCHHGTDTAYFSPSLNRIHDDQPPVLLSVGRLVPKKGFEVLMDAAAILHRKRVAFRIDIIGDGPLRETLSARIESHGLRDVMRLHGMAVRQEVRQAMRAADGFVLASRITADGDRDGIPNTIAEAMACGLPVVATRLEGIGELVLEGATGLLVQPDNPEELAAALERLLRDRALGRAFGQAGRQRVLEMFDSASWSRHLSARLGASLGVRNVLLLHHAQGRECPDAQAQATTSVQSPERPSARLIAATSGEAQDETALQLADRLRDRFGISIWSLPLPMDQPPAAPGSCSRRHSMPDARPLGALGRWLWAQWERYRFRWIAARFGRACHADVVYECGGCGTAAGATVARRLGVPYMLAPDAAGTPQPRARGSSAFARAAQRRRWKCADVVVARDPQIADALAAAGVGRERILLAAAPRPSGDQDLQAGPGLAGTNGGTGSVGRGRGDPATVRSDAWDDVAAALLERIEACRRDLWGWT